MAVGLASPIRTIKLDTKRKDTEGSTDQFVSANSSTHSCLHSEATGSQSADESGRRSLSELQTEVVGGCFSGFLTTSTSDSQTPVARQPTDPVPSLRLLVRFRIHSVSIKTNEVSLLPPSVLLSPPNVTDSTNSADLSAVVRELRRPLPQ